MDVYPAWAEHHRVLLEAIGGDDYSRPALVEAMVRGGTEAWRAINFFCEAVMQARKWRSTSGSCKLQSQAPAGCGARCVISGHRSRRRLADGELMVALRPSLLALLKGPPYLTNCLSRPREPFKRQIAYLATEGTGRVFSQ